MVSAHATLTAGRLRHLARLHRDGVEGADQELLGLAAEAPEQLTELLGHDVQWLDDARQSKSVAELIVASIEDAPRRARQHGR